MRPDNMTGASLDQLCLNGTPWMNNDGQQNTKKRGERINKIEEMRRMLKRDNNRSKKKKI